MFSLLFDKVGGGFRRYFFFFVPDSLLDHTALVIVWNVLATIIVLAMITGLGYLSRYFLGQFFGSLPSLGSSPAFTNSFDYDGLDRLRDAQSTITGGGSGSLFPREQYAFDTLARMTTRTIGTATPTAYQYNDTAHKDAPTSYGAST